jgi:ribosome-associated toxin RatA of RatAB toxin-antitoxin module
MLESSNENNFQNSYQRYRLLTEFSENFNYESYDSKTLLKNFLDAFVGTKTFTSNPSFLSFKSLVNELVDSFLYNKKNGLDGELSTRIRHGELENQMRSVFDKNQLISKKGDDGLYTNLSYWNDLLSSNLDDDGKNQIQEIFKEFSKTIDSIIQFLVVENIQVKSENYPNKKHGFFDYQFPESVFKILYDKSCRSQETYAEFVEGIFSTLKIYTASHLQDVSNHLTITLRKKIDSELDSLGDKIMSISTNLVELNQNIIDAKVEFQNEILAISNWFIVANSAVEKTMDLRTIIECSFESSNIQHPNTPIQPKINVNYDELRIFKYKHFIFIFLNLIENIRIHSKLTTDELDVTVSVTYDQNNLEFSVKNNFDKSAINLKGLNTTFEKIKEKWKNEVDQEYVNRESGSGYEKIKKMLVYDMNSRMNSFDFIINENTLEVIFGVELSLN